MAWLQLLSGIVPPSGQNVLALRALQLISYWKTSVLKELNSVRLKKPLPRGDVPVGSDGVVLYVYQEPTLGYEVDFF
jgi:hypothetical protein